MKAAQGGVGEFWSFVATHLAVSRPAARIMAKAFLKDNREFINTHLDRVNKSRQIPKAAETAEENEKKDPGHNRHLWRLLKNLGNFSTPATHIASTQLDK